LQITDSLFFAEALEPSVPAPTVQIISREDEHEEDISDAGVINAPISPPSDVPEHIQEEPVDAAIEDISLVQQPEVVHVLSSSDSGPEEGELGSTGMSLHGQQQEDVDLDSDGDDSAMSLEDSAQDDSPIHTENSLTGEDSSMFPDPAAPETSQDGDSNRSRQRSREPVEVEDAGTPDSGHERDVSESPDESDDDIYEPPDAIAPAIDDESVESPPFSPAPPDTFASDPFVSMPFDLRPAHDTLPEPARASSAFEQSRPVFPQQVSTPS